MSPRAKVIARCVVVLAICGAVGAVEAKIVKTKRPVGKAHEVVVGSRIEFESKDYDLPVLLEWNPSEKLQFAAEITHSTQELDDGSQAHGLKDLELSAVYEFLPQRRNRPGLALELDLKLPTSSNRQIDTGKADVGIGLLAFKDFVRWDFEMSAIYTFVGSPRGVKLDNVWDLTVAAEWHARPRLDVFGEIAISGGGAVGGANRNGFGLGGFQSAIATGGGTETELTIGVAENLTRRLRLEQGAAYTSDGTLRWVLGWEYNFGSTH